MVPPSSHKEAPSKIKMAHPKTPKALFILTICLCTTLLVSSQSNDCSGCSDVGKAAATCFTSSDCKIEDCTSVSSCCPACSNEISAASECYGACMPACVEETIAEYGVCFTFNRCQTACSSYWSDYETKVTETTESWGVDIQGDNVDVQILEAVPESATCDDYQTYIIPSVCQAGSCCSKCYGKLMAITECVVNEGIYPIKTGETGDCSFSCSATRWLQTTGEEDTTQRHRRAATTAPFDISSLPNAPDPSSVEGVFISDLGECKDLYATVLSLSPLDATPVLNECIMSKTASFSVRSTANSSNNLTSDRSGQSAGAGQSFFASIMPILLLAGHWIYG